MKSSAKIFVLLGAFFLFAGIVYGYGTHLSERGFEPTGFTALIVSVFFSLFAAFYLWFTDKKMSPGPDDDPFGEIDQIQGDYGFFSPHSWWPLALASAAALLFLGVAVGWWIFAIGAFLGVPALIGWTFEYYKGPHAN